MDRETIESMERDYVRGFNDGYVISGRLPELAKQLSHGSLEAPWFEGFRDGREQYLHEQVKEMRPSWLQGGRNAQAPPAPGQDRDAEYGRNSQDGAGQTETARSKPPKDRDQDHER